MKLIILIFAISFFFAPGVDIVFGRTHSSDFTLTNPICGGNPNCTFGDVANNILDFLLDVSIPLVAIMVVIGGFQILTAGGDPAKFTTGRKTVTYAAVGFAVVLISKGVVSVIRELF